MKAFASTILPICTIFLALPVLAQPVNQTEENGYNESAEGQAAGAEYARENKLTDPQDCPADSNWREAFVAGCTAEIEKMKKE